MVFDHDGNDHGRLRINDLEQFKLELFYFGIFLELLTDLMLLTLMGQR